MIQPRRTALIRSNKKTRKAAMPGSSAIPTQTASLAELIERAEMACRESRQLTREAKAMLHKAKEKAKEYADDHVPAGRIARVLSPLGVADTGRRARAIVPREHP